MEPRSQLGADEAEGVASSQMAWPAGVGVGDGAGADAGEQYAVDNVTGTEQDPIDLTKEGDQDMQKALMLSMQDMQSTTGSGVLSLEEQELSRALEASLRENNVNMSKPVLALFQDPKNPHKRKRTAKTPVGLKNIGNTCWFSAVIQSLYHIPAFRREILGYFLPPFPNGISQPPQCVAFVLELQRLFALLLKSHKMYIDPSLAIQSLQETFSKEHSHTGAQQDVSEFTHKLLELIENAFKLSLESGASERGNPILELFNGHYRTEGINNDKPFISESDFGAYPIQVRGHTHLHDSLESATFNTDMQQQTFFTRFQPILVLELSRFQYNQTTKQAEKVHDQLDFDLQLYVDRYLVENKAESCQRKLEVDRLRKKRKELDTRLEWYMHYHQKPMSITDILSLTLAFVHDEKTWEQQEDQKSEEQAEKRARTSLYPSPRYKSEKELETLEQCLTRWTEELLQDMEDLQTSISASKASLDAVYSDPLMNRTPYYLHAVMVHQGEASGGHYWAYVRKHPSLSIPGPGATPDSSQSKSHDVHHESTADGTGGTERGGNIGVGESIGSDGKIGYRTQLETGEIYVDVMQSPESMVATDESASVSCASVADPAASESVAAGQGTVAGEGMEVEKCGGGGEEEGGGMGRNGWMKFNDVSVSEVSWEEVRRESLGGAHGNTSAYCLVYVNRLLHDDWLSSATPPCLSQELNKYVEESNLSFMKELIEHDRNIKTAGHISSDVTVGSNGCPPSPLGVVMSPAASSLSAAAAPESALPAGPRQEDRSPQELMQIDSPPDLPISPTLQTQLTKLISNHHYQLLQLTKQYEEPRPLSVAAYAIHSDSPKSILRMLALDEIALANTEERIKMFAKREYIHGLSVMAHERNNPLDTLKQNYRSFVTLCWFFVQAMKMVIDRNFTETLMLCLRASHLHKAIQSGSPTTSRASLHQTHLRLLQSLKCKALQEVSSKAYHMFEMGKIRDGIQVANTLVVPALGQLSRESGQEEVEVVLEKVREEWCQCLNRPDLNEGEQDQLGDLLTRILDDSGKVPSLPDIRGSDIDMDHLDCHTLVTDMATYVRQLTQQHSGGSFLGI